MKKKGDFHHADPRNVMKEVNLTFPPCSVPQVLLLTGSAVALNPMSWPHAPTSLPINSDAVQAVSGFHFGNVGPSARCSIAGLSGIFVLLRRLH